MNTRKDPSDNRIPYTLSPAYDRAKCGSCASCPATCRSFATAVRTATIALFFGNGATPMRGR